MSSNYSDITDRLTAYRKGLNKNQEQMGVWFGVTQSHYAKLEAGSKRISLQSLKLFEKNGGDVCGLLTGVEKISSPLDKYVAECKTSVGQVKLLEYTMWAMEMVLEMPAPREKIFATYKSLELQKNDDEKVSILEKLRNNEQMSQEKMAKLLDINVKRYRRLEKEQVEPDAEILYELYQKLHYSPLVFLKREEYYLDELNQCWNQLSTEKQQRLGQMIEENLVHIKEFEERMEKRC